VTALPVHLHAEHDAVQAAIQGVLAGHPGAAQAGIAAMDLARDRVVAVARTEIQSAATQTALALYAGNVAIGGAMFLATLDSATCLICAPLHGTVYVYDAARRLSPDFRAPPVHPRCLVAGAIVRAPSDVRAATERWYTGEIVEIRTESGAVLTVTPNHPILTTRGWVAAGELHEGGDVVRCPDPERMAKAINPDDHDVPARIEDVFRAFRGPLGVCSRTVPTAPEDFHGDGGGSEVCIVRTDRLLGDRLDTSLGEPLTEGHLSEGAGPRDALTPDRLLAQVVERLGHAPNLGVCGLGIGPVLLRGSARRQQAIGGDLVADRHASRHEPSPNDEAGDAVPLGDLVLRDTGGIGSDRVGVGRQPTLAGGRSLGPRQPVTIGDRAPESTLPESVAQPDFANMEAGGRLLARLVGHVRADRILECSRRSFVGHVYNLETAEGWYTANGIVTHNCRCLTSPVTRSLPELYHPPAVARVEPPGARFTFERWLRRRPVAEQREVLGPARLAEWRDGVPLGAFSDQGRVLTLGELRGMRAAAK
jgi:hypothetical protein